MKLKDNPDKFSKVVSALILHFPDFDYEKGEPNCSYCQDYLTGVCPGENRTGESVIACMLNKHIEWVI